METNGNFKKYFDALNKRLDGEFAAIHKRLDAIEGRLDATEGRLDTVEERLALQGQLISAMQKTQQALSDSFVLLIRELKELKRRVTGLESRVERLERGQTEMIKMLADIRGLESGKKLELKEVQYDDKARTRTGTIRERRIKYGRKNA